MESAINIMHADTASIQTVDPKTNELLLLTHKGFHPQSAETWRRINIDSTTSCGLALAKGERIVFADVDDVEIEIGGADHEAYRLSGIIAMQSTPLVSRSGKPLGMISTHWKKKHQPSVRELNLFDVLARQAADIIEQKLAEEALRDSQGRMRQLLSLMPAAVYTCDAEGRITFFNRRAAELWGREPKLNDVQEKFSGSFRMWSQDGILLMHESCPMADAILEGRTVRDLELVVEQPSGLRLVVNVNIDPLFDANGKLIGAINVFTDITERKQAEKALHESEAWLNGQKEAFQAAMSGQSLATSLEALIHTVTAQTSGEARASFYLIPQGGQGLHLVAGMSEEYGHDINGFKVGPESLACGLAMHTGETVITPDVELDPVWEPWLPIARKHNYRASWSFPVRTAGGPVVGTFAMYFEEPRNPTARELELAGIVAHAAAIIISRDTELNERTEAENALRKNEVHLKQLLKQKDEFIGIASHELKTPITSMKTYAEIMMEAFEETGDRMSATLMKKLHKQIDRLTSLTKDLLDTGKISEGQLQLFVEEADLNALITERLEELKRISAIHKILFNAGELKPVVVDKERIGQVVTNLVSNAIKYSPDGGEIVVSTRTDENNNVTVSVQDYGIGISKSEQYRVFERFYRVNNVKNQNFSGMGLGLYISSQIINRHGGNINVQSEEGRGSTFSFSLPSK
ncbi:ATP-binding protein [Danxiaibacter flavus]|uniref:histidine kinase n=1 Tax=Danxiaibacter flavus TaxID=3049108 RepID=A0ABV3ZL37_9BACT|nr:ATP-binding protein [Chitinophagaceae bacterium DXS]